MAVYEHILLVDDNPDDRALVLREVKSEEPEAVISEAINARELQQKLDTIKFDLVITDYQLNWSNGLEVLNLVKKLQPTCSVIMFTATGGEEIAVEAMKNGLQDYILKSPNHLKRLRSSVRMALDQVQQRRALQVAENRYRDLFHSIPIGLYQTSPKGRFMEVNRAMVTMLGYPDTETLLDLPTKDLYVNQDQYKQWKSRITEYGYVRNLEVEMWRYDRSVIWVEINGKTVYKNGKFSYNEGSLQDITERVIAEQNMQKTASKAAQLAKRNAELYGQVQKYNSQLEVIIEKRTSELKKEIEFRQSSEIALRESEKRYRSVVDRVREAICKLDCDGKITFLNPAWHQITQYDMEESLGKPFYTFFDETDTKTVLSTLEDIYDSRYSHSQIQLSVRRKDGVRRWVEVYIDSEKDASGVIQGAFVMLYDVTERKNAEDEMQRAFQKEKELSELRSQFISMTSHEFRTPLASILTSSELLEHYGHKWPIEKNHTHLKRIQSSVQQIISLMDDVFILGKSDAGKLVANKELSNPLEMLQNILDEIQLNFGKTHEIDLQVTDLIGECWIDRKLFRQIVNNIITNSLKYSSEGSTITIRLSQSGGDLTFDVEDQGIGIPEKDQSQLFESFFRAGNVGNRPGTGLGLPIVKRSVDAHNGKIDVYSKESSGTIINITLDVTNNR